MGDSVSVSISPQWPYGFVRRDMMPRSSVPPRQTLGAQSLIQREREHELLCEFNINNSAGGGPVDIGVLSLDTKKVNVLPFPSSLQKWVTSAITDLHRQPLENCKWRTKVSKLAFPQFYSSKISFSCIVQ